MCGISALLVTAAQDSDSATHLSCLSQSLEEYLRCRGPDSFSKSLVSVSLFVSYYCVNLVVVSNSELRLKLIIFQVTRNGILMLLNSLLQIRGNCPRRSTLRDEETGNILLWNGEVFEGIDMAAGDNDGECILAALRNAKMRSDVANCFSKLRGPWAMVFWHATTKSFWFGRDVMGRKSLLVKMPSQSNEAFVLTSVRGNSTEIDEFREVEPGMYVMDFSNFDEASQEGRGAIPDIERIPWYDEDLLSIGAYLRDSETVEINQTGMLEHSRRSDYKEKLLTLLQDATYRRSNTIEYFPGPNGCASTPMKSTMVLFSGGVDSTLIAALLDRSLPKGQPIELCSICFAKGTSPDRKGSLQAFLELKKSMPDREWRFIAIDSSYEELRTIQNRVLALLHPASTVMDFNIGGALWLASRGQGEWIKIGEDGKIVEIIEKDYRSEARTVFLGHGADELFGGYSRHRTRFRNHGWSGLAEELRLDVRRLWIRNFGRDDRIISDHGREARLPFMDEHVIQFALKTPLEVLVDFDLPCGQGDKMILRQCLNSLGFKETAARPKRALQFGSRLAKAANENQFGGTKQANKNSAGSVKLSEVLN